MVIEGGAEREAAIEVVPNVREVAVAGEVLVVEVPVDEALVAVALAVEVGDNDDVQ